MLGYITDPSAPAGLDRRELPDPEPGPHDVLVAVRAYAINRGELNLLEQRADGWRPGQDLAGVVAQAAADGSGPAPGTPVVGVADGAGWAERATVPSHRVARRCPTTWPSPTRRPSRSPGSPRCERCARAATCSAAAS